MRVEGHTHSERERQRHGQHREEEEEQKKIINHRSAKFHLPRRRDKKNSASSLRDVFPLHCSGIEVRYTYRHSAGSSPTTAHRGHQRHTNWTNTQSPAHTSMCPGKNANKPYRLFETRTVYPPLPPQPWAARYPQKTTENSRKLSHEGDPCSRTTLYL